MAMRALRDGASGGILKYFLLGLLALAAGGLVFTDVGGFFRSGGVGSNNVLKVGSQKISIGEFHNQLSAVLRRIGMSANDAYQAGYMNQFISEQVRTSIIQQSAEELGVAIDEERAAKTIRTIIQPAIAQGRTPEEALNQILRLQGTNEARFIQAIQNQTAAQPFLAALQNGGNIVSSHMLNDVVTYQTEKRAFDYVILKNDNASGLTQPEDAQLISLYEMMKEEYAIAETREFQIIEVDYQASEDASEDESFEERYAIADVIDDLAASGETAEEIGKQGNVKISKPQTTGLFNKDISQTILQPLFELEEGEISPVIETDDDRLLAVSLISITPKSYEPFKKVKTKIKEKWINDQKAMNNKLTALEATGQVNKGERQLSSVGAVKKASNITRTDEPPKPFTLQNLNTVFGTPVGKAAMLNLPDGLAIIQITKSEFPDKADEETKNIVKTNLEQAIQNENVLLYLEKKRQGMDIRVNESLLEKAYGTQDDL